MIKCTGWALFYVSMTCTAPPQPVLDTFCQNYKPVYWATADTRKTKEQNDINNRRWKKLCGQGAR
jgi:hypothetical protein